MSLRRVTWKRVKYREGSGKSEFNFCAHSVRNKSVVSFFLHTVPWSATESRRENSSTQASPQWWRLNWSTQTLVFCDRNNRDASSKKANVACRQYRWFQPQFRSCSFVWLWVTVVHPFVMFELAPLKCFAAVCSSDTLLLHCLIWH